jgi:hypothetical protein
MRELWCWRCNRVVPMLDEGEWAEVEELLHAGRRSIKDYRQRYDLPLAEVATAEWSAPALNAYERVTGHRETDPEALRHHRLSLYGPPCENCGKPLRTPKAKMCAACGARRAF